ncbi:hypothetical protein ACJX0J_012182, partial [Zea mays]
SIQNTSWHGICCARGSGNISGMDLAMFLELTQKLLNSINFLMLDYTAQKDKDAYAGDFVNIKIFRCYKLNFMNLSHLFQAIDRQYNKLKGKFTNEMAIGQVAKIAVLQVKYGDQQHLNLYMTNMDIYMPVEINEGAYIYMLENIGHLYFLEQNRAPYDETFLACVWFAHIILTPNGHFLYSLSAINKCNMLSGDQGKEYRDHQTGATKTKWTSVLSKVFIAFIVESRLQNYYPANLAQHEAMRSYCTGKMEVLDQGFLAL